jgi:hypothetical protein
MNFLYLCSPYPLRFVSTACLSLTFSDSMKHYRGVGVRAIYNKSKFSGIGRVTLSFFAPLACLREIQKRAEKGLR